ncbi:hypothetical protein [Blastococcus colisei]|uniref:hypothetical protein n=1 Tax=Blastococcus colisei TaxID=1564162 RepID=UPI001150861F|nr:hypothetical protein [Blastococcus colisei]
MSLLTSGGSSLRVRAEPSEYGSGDGAVTVDGLSDSGHEYTTICGPTTHTGGTSGSRRSRADHAAPQATVEPDGRPVSSSTHEPQHQAVETRP